MIREYDTLGVYVIMEDQDDYDAVNNGDLTEVDVAFTGRGNWKCVTCGEEFEIGEKIYVRVLPFGDGHRLKDGSYCKQCVEKEAVSHAL